MRRALALLPLLIAACADTVVLGTECVTRGACESYRPPANGEGIDGGGSSQEIVDSGEDPPASSLDGGTDDPPPPDAPTDGGRAPVRDAGSFPIRDAARPPPVPPDAGPAEFPSFTNPSFELVDGGSEGELATGLNAQSASQSPIAPWYVCRGGTTVTSQASYVSGLPPRTTMVTPREGNTFVSDTFPIVVGNINGITQELREPLAPGKRYAFAVDVFAQPDAIMLRELVLDFRYADSYDCIRGFAGFPLAMTTPITPGAWETKCIDFIAPQADPLSRSGVRYVMFMASAPLDPVNFTTLHFDNIRPSAMCGNVVADAGMPDASAMP